MQKRGVCFLAANQVSVYKTPQCSCHSKLYAVAEEKYTTNR